MDPLATFETTGKRRTPVLLALSIYVSALGVAAGAIVLLTSALIQQGLVPLLEARAMAAATTMAANEPVPPEPASTP